jgi:hypothetical protein
MLDLRLNKGPGPALCFVRQMPPSSMRAFMPSVTIGGVTTAGANLKGVYQAIAAKVHS